MDTRLLISTLLICLSVDAQWDCRTYLGDKGRCVPIYDCPSINSIAKKTHKEFLEILKHDNCGYVGNDPKVCCPNVIEERIQGDACLTPDGEKGTCKDLRDCDYMRHEILDQGYVSQETMEFMKRSKCNNVGVASTAICCKQNNDRFPPTTSQSPNNDLFTNRKGCALNAFPPLPSTKCCGIESSSDVRIISGNVTAIDQFPWVVKLGYTREAISCGGSLISGKYVLTAAHCLVGPSGSSRRAINVVLGEFDTNNPGRDCVEVPGGGIDCTDGAITVDIESIVVHKGYDPKKQVYQHHDIALIRLKETVQYTEFIRPICLPTEDFTLSAPDNLLLYVAGWGIFDNTMLASPLKLYGMLPYVGKEQCDLRYGGNRAQSLVSSQICVGGEANKDACKGDSGGPLMYLNGDVYEAAGVISFGPSTCGLENWPSIYTKVYDYLDWIRENIKP